MLQRRVRGRTAARQTIFRVHDTRCYPSISDSFTTQVLSQLLRYSMACERTIETLSRHTKLFVTSALLKFRRHTSLSLTSARLNLTEQVEYIIICTIPAFQIVIVFYRNLSEYLFSTRDLAPRDLHPRNEALRHCER